MHVQCIGYTEMELKERIRKLAARWLTQRNDAEEESHRKLTFLSNVHKELTKEGNGDIEMLDVTKDLIDQGGLAQYGSSDGSGSGTVQKDDKPYVDNYCSTEAADRIYTQKLKLQENCPVPMQIQTYHPLKCDEATSSAARHAQELLEAEEKERGIAEKRRLKKKAKKKKKKQLDSKSTSREEEPLGRALEAPSTLEAEESARTRIETETGELDVNSAFVARATAKISTIGVPATSKLTASTTKSIVDINMLLAEENVPDPYDEIVIGSRQLADAGNKAAKNEDYLGAIGKYSEAIEIYPFDHRYFGNRSYCYDYIQDHKSALDDANTAIKLNPDWPKGYFLKARALLGLSKYEEAEASFLKTLQLDPNYKDANEHLLDLQLGQLNKMGFDPLESERALRKHKTIQASVQALLSGNVQKFVLHEDNGTADLKKTKMASLSSEPLKKESSNPTLQLKSLWVGNINSPDITEELLHELFGRYGAVTSIRVIHERWCAFVNYSEEQSAAAALEALQDYTISGTRLLLRYPTRPTSENIHASKLVPVNGNECYFWRHIGNCSYGTQCKYLHLPEKKGIDGHGGRAERNKLDHNRINY